MKKLLFLALSIFLAFLSNAQNSNFSKSLNYQAVVRNSNNVVEASKPVNFKFIILDALNNPVYAETKSVSTDVLGQVNIAIGTGIAIPPIPNTTNIISYSSLDWKQNYRKLRVELDINNGNNFTNMGDIELQSVPYANIANEALNVKENLSQLNDVNTTSVQIGQVLKWNGAKWVAQNDDISSGGSGTTYTGGQGINVSGNQISNIGDLSNTNELQTLSQSGNTVTLSQGGGSFQLPLVSNYSDGTGINIVPGIISNTFFINNTAPSKWTQSGNDITNSNGGKVGIGTSSFNNFAQLEVVAPIGNGAIHANGVTGTGVSATSINNAILGSSTGSGYGIEGTSTNGIGGYFSSTNGKALVTGTGNIGFGTSTLANNTRLTVVAPTNGVAIAAQGGGGVGLAATSVYTAVSGVSMNGFGVSGVSTNGTGGYFSSTNGTALITENGKVGIGTNNPLVDFHVAGDVRVEGNADFLSGIFSKDIFPFQNDAYSLGASNNRWKEIWCTTSLNTTSDRREKQNIKSLEYGLKDVMKLRPVTFEWIKTPERGSNIGFIAQELQEVVKEVVVDKEWTTDANGKSVAKNTDRLAVKYLDIIPVLTKAIQEQQAIIEKQQRQLNMMQAQIDAIKK